MFCTKCGKKAEEGTKFCTDCGTLLEAKATVEETPAAAYEEPTPVTPPPAFKEPEPAAPVTPPTPPVAPPVPPVAPPVPPVAPPTAGNLSPTVSTATFFWMDLVLAIPLVGLIVCIVLACGATSKQSLRNWAKAKLIWALVSVILFLLLSIVAVSLLSRYYYVLLDLLNQF